MTAGPDSSCAWTVALDRLEAEVAALDTALAAGRDVALSIWTPPDDLGPMPASLRSRAGGVLRRMEAAQARARHGLDELAGELETVQRRRRAGATYGGESTTTA